ncbi:trypsin-like peptidase domain-containing protein [Kitasatospora sp. RG8]|uniref:putative Ig domain-containing protein n=2 Tax=unclassified Kitasatospora TaxID=2633591 RepID=UPI001ADEFDD2|nr:putative Ig domain-containing protein [Kitasatospora sp. RG8]MBP0455437.1 trypsin-like peptidase domain-containing protein [Kitasatospora sp. RG8]
MLKRLAAVVGASAVVAGGLTLAATPAQAVQAGDLTSTIALSNCSASLVRYPSSVDTDRAMMLTNGHCLPTMPAAGVVIQNQSASRSGTLLSSSGSSLGTVQADKVLYATMTGTDVALYQLTDTFGSVTSKYGATALTISDTHPADGSAMYIPSSYWKQVWDCSINGFVPTLREDAWTWHDSIRYSSGCNTTHGTSGSPIVDAATKKIVGINNTGNDDGAMCTLNNPCEVAADGTTTVTKGQSYGEQTYWFTTCLGNGRVIDLNVSGCLLTKPAGSGAVSVTNPGPQSTGLNAPVNLQISASGGTAPLTYSAAGLPAGLSINASTGLITGTATTAGTSTVTVTVKDSAGKTATTSFSWTISRGDGCIPAQLLGNAGFETGSAAPWTASSGVVDNSASQAAHGGSWKAWMNGYGSTHSDNLSQTVTIPAGCKASLSFYLHIDTAESGSTQYDKLTVTVNGTALKTYSNVDAAAGYQLRTFDLSSYAGQAVTLKFAGTEDSSLQTSFVIDDTSIATS